MWCTTSPNYSSLMVGILSIIRSQSIFPTMDDNLMSEIAQSVDDGEVRSTIFGMHPLKAPGVDGLHALLYQSQWNTVGNSV